MVKTSLTRRCRHIRTRHVDLGIFIDQVALTGQVEAIGLEGYRNCRPLGCWNYFTKRWSGNIEAHRLDLTLAVAIKAVLNGLYGSSSLSLKPLVAPVILFSRRQRVNQCISSYSTVVDPLARFGMRKNLVMIVFGRERGPLYAPL